MIELKKLSSQLKKLPRKPGVYQFFNAKGEILYIGKAKNLYTRVGSYFTKDKKGYKHSVMVNKICEIKYILVENESDAFLLENNLIKEYQPRYNILLKDDKTFPWICIKNENFPRVFKTRQYQNDKSDYFGPYTSGIMVNTLLKLIRQIYPLRTCNLKLEDKNIENGKYKKCLEFQLGNCKAPCEGLQTKEEYIESIEQIRAILKGNLHQVVKYLSAIMKNYSNDMRYEEAYLIKQKIEIFNKFNSKSTIVNPRISNVDVIYMIYEHEKAYASFFKIINGSIVQAHNVELVNRLNEEKEDLLSYVIFNLRQKFRSQAEEIIAPFIPSMIVPGIKITVPKKGDKKKLLDLSKRNAFSFKNDKESLKNKFSIDEKELEILEKLKKDLRLKEIPKHIECFDISNIQGNQNVASCVVFLNAKPKKSEYRHYNIKSVKGANDFASMQEVVFRRYSKVTSEKLPVPDLIIIDGGKGQLNAAVESIKKAGLYSKVAIISIAKRLEEIYAPNDPIPLYINKNSSSLRLLQKIRNEAHRFGINFHRGKRSALFLKSELLSIPGIGEKTVVSILSKHRDLEQIKQMDLLELQRLTGIKAAKRIYHFYHSV